MYVFILKIQSEWNKNLHEISKYYFDNEKDERDHILKELMQKRIWKSKVLIWFQDSKMVYGFAWLVRFKIV